MSKTKIVEKIVRFELFLTVIGQLVKVTKRKTFQNKIFPELNSKKHTPSPTVWFLRNCAKLEFRKSGIGQFCAKWLLRMIAQIVVFFFAQNWCAKKQKFSVSFRKNCAKVLRMETLGILSSVLCFSNRDASVNKKIKMTLINERQKFGDSCIFSLHKQTYFPR